MLRVMRTERTPREPLRLADHAASDLRFIRDTLTRASTFTSLSGWGQIAVGVVGLAAAAIASRADGPDRWLLVWLAAAIVGLAIGVGTAHAKAQRSGLPLFGMAGQRFALGFATPAIAGGVLTAALERSGATGLLPGTWLLLYGAAIVGGGAFAIACVPVMGGVFMALGVAAFLTPPAWGTLWLAAGFGLVHVAFGAWILRRHGG